MNSHTLDDIRDKARKQKVINEIIHQVLMARIGESKHYRAKLNRMNIEQLRKEYNRVMALLEGGDEHKAPA